MLPKDTCPTCGIPGRVYPLGECYGYAWFACGRTRRTAS